MKRRTAVVLFNLGGPDSLAAVQPFLYRLFSDPDIFKFPLGFITQKLFAELISRRRAKAARKNYAAIGGQSPLLAHTLQQADRLQSALQENSNNADTVTHVCMRYWHPLTNEVVTNLRKQQIEKIILLPLYPQYSITTTGSSYNEFMRECDKQHYHPEIRLIHHWYNNEDYQQAVADSIRKAGEEFSSPDPDKIELLISAHGLPRKIIDAGDVYEQHINETYEAVVKQLGWPHVSLCYQSRVGPFEWLQPYTNVLIRQKAQAGARQMLVYPIAFVSDHVETLYELGIEYAKIAQEQGITEYRVVPALNDHPLLIQALKKLILNNLTSESEKIK
jgi:protoporphyrin/coproporphyrin ferrochelatase